MISVRYEDGKKRRRKINLLKKEECFELKMETAAQKIDICGASASRHYTAACEPAAHPGDFQFPLTLKKIMSL